MNSEEIFENLKDIFLQEHRLVERLRYFFDEYNNFEFDEMGLNMEEVDNIGNKAIKIKEKLFEKIQNQFPYKIDKIKTDIKHNKVVFDVIVEHKEEENETFGFSVIVEDEGFILEHNLE